MFTQPDVLASTSGRLDVTLVAAPSKVAFGAGKRFAYTYNGTTPGPTLRVRPGDVLSITLVNRLGEATNLHTHGLHVSPSGHADNVFVSIPDGDHHTYRYQIPPDHRSGMFWYHPHIHGMVAPQVFGGLAGAIIVEDALDLLPAGRLHRTCSRSSVTRASETVERRERVDDGTGCEGAKATLWSSTVSSLPTITARAGHA